MRRPRRFLADAKCHPAHRSAPPIWRSGARHVPALGIAVPSSVNTGSVTVLWYQVAARTSGSTGGNIRSKFYVANADNVKTRSVSGNHVRQSNFGFAVYSDRAARQVTLRYRSTDSPFVPDLNWAIAATMAVEICGASVLVDMLSLTAFTYDSSNTFQTIPGLSTSFSLTSASIVMFHYQFSGFAGVRATSLLTRSPIHLPPEPYILTSHLY